MKANTVAKTMEIHHGAFQPSGRHSQKYSVYGHAEMWMSLYVSRAHVSQQIESKCFKRGVRFWTPLESVHWEIAGYELEVFSKSALSMFATKY